MKTTIDASGRLVIPKDIRREAGLQKGMELEIRVRNGVIEIEPTYMPVKLIRKGWFLVAVPEGDVEPLTAEAVQAILDDMRRERGGT